MDEADRYAGLSDEQLHEVHNACETFEQALRNEKPIRIEDGLAAAPEEIRPALFRELLAIDLERQEARDRPPQMAEYQARFPDRKDDIEEAFLELPTKARPADVRPGKIGRYRIDDVLGSGAFGRVYLAYDEGLQRPVAIKVPHAALLPRPEEASRYLAEARAVARLDHPNIVPVQEVGSTDKCPCYIVFKHVDGTDLAMRIKRSRLSYAAAAELVATLAGALHYAHKHGVVHRDVKPGNILIDTEGQPHLVDFGLALQGQDPGRRGPRMIGTPHYMSPEQARGEGHRVDGRSDIYSLGAVLYELLVGRRTFCGETQAELLERITTQDPRPPRQIDDHVPRELERICLKALSRRASERYTTALDMAEDLRHFLGTGQSSTTASWAEPPRTAADPPGAAGPGSTTMRDPDSHEIRIVPKGLRAFDEEDADFFLELLPGPRDRDGLPESLRFWKTRIERGDANRTFAVGLIYGPSGCGKSSLVQAGLLPRLPETVNAVYVEATPGETEARLLGGLRQRCPGLPADLDLKRTLEALRLGQGVPGGQKVLIVLDQFEQWLHANKERANPELVQALRQCDGGRLQCIVMVRDDFWLAVSRFMLDLEVDLVPGRNIALVDLFDPDHARKILAALGRAFGRLPENRGEMSREQRDFLKQAVTGLADEGKVVCVRLAVFAEMMKGKPWTLAALKEVGGTRGIGVTFLEETFGAPTANPRHRRHQKAASAVLKALLPESGSDLKGHMRSEKDLLAASGYAERPRDFDELIRILDNEVRLITPTEPEGVAGDEWRVAEMERSSPSTLHPPPSTRFYHLTHDYLVHSLRTWLTRKQKETRRGRAELRLVERSAAWNDKPENRHLPSLREWGTIRLLTDRRTWTGPQRRMMRKASRLHLIRRATELSVVLGISLIIQQMMATTSRRHLAERTRTAVAATANSRGAIVPRVIEDLEALPRDAVLEELRARFADGKEGQKLALAYALAHFGSVEVDVLVEHIRSASANEVDNLVTALGDSRKDALEALHAAAVASEARTDWRLKQRLAVVAWHLADPSLARDMCRLRPDPVQRTVFIDQVASWQGEASRLATFARTMVDPALRSGICLGIGSTLAEQVTEEVIRAWQPLLTDWYQQDPDKGVHSAAGWALRHWQRPLPAMAASHRPAEGQQWHVNSLGMTMLEIPAGSFNRRDNTYGFARDGTVINLFGRSERAAGVAENVLQKVTLTRPFLLCDREVSVGLFRQFARDPDYPSGENSTDWPGADPAINPTADHPVQRVRWIHALLFCNWLSRKEGLQPCYERTGQIVNFGSYGRHEQWRLIPDASGYRLPTEAEGEYACRAGTVTQYSFGDEEGLASRYAVQGTNRTQVCGSKLPNGWGLFDLHGNVMEWCQDCMEPYGTQEAVSDPMERGNDKSVYRMVRGGSFNYGTLANTSSKRHAHPFYSHDFYIGFRVARTVTP